MPERKPYAWVHLYEPLAHYDDAAPVLTFQRRPVVIYPWIEIPLYTAVEISTPLQFVCWMAERYVEKRDLYAFDAFRAAELAYNTLIRGEKIAFGDPAHDWSRDAANTLA